MILAYLLAVVVTVWLSCRRLRTTVGRLLLPVAGAAGSALTFILFGFHLTSLGVQSWAMALLATAAVAFLGFVLADAYLVADPERATARSKVPLVLRVATPVAASALVLWGVLPWLNPISHSATPKSSPEGSISAGEMTVTAYPGAIVAEGPQGGWSYSHQGSHIGTWPNQFRDHPYLIASPDGAHIAVAFVISVPEDGGDSVQQHVRVFETATGRVVAERSSRTFINVQLTNGAALLGREAVSLETGAALWRSDLVPLVMPSMTATPTQFVIDARCGTDVDQLGSCELDLLGQDGQGMVTTVSGVLADPVTVPRDSNRAQLVMADGWVLRRVGEAQPTPKDAQPIPVGVDAVAYHLDTGEEIPVGRTGGPDLATSPGLGLRPEYTFTSEEQRIDEAPVATTRFDPETKTVTR